VALRVGVGRKGKSTWNVNLRCGIKGVKEVRVPRVDSVVNERVRNWRGEGDTQGKKCGNSN